MPAAEELWKHGHHFIDIIKTATWQFMMVYLSNIEFQNRGNMSGLLTRPVDKTKLMLGASIWMDRNRWYFTIAGGLMEKGQPYARTQRKQEYPAPNAEPNMVELTIQHTITAYLYYSPCGRIDGRNRCHQESLDIEKKVRTTDWSKQINLYVVAINGADV